MLAVHTKESAAQQLCTPYLDWALTPLRPGETVLITGSCLTNATLRVCSSAPLCAPTCIQLPIVQQWDISIKATLPATLPIGVFAFTAQPGGNSLSVNTPAVDWMSTNSWKVGTAFATGDVILYGKALAFSQPRDGSGVLDCLPTPPLVNGGPALLPPLNLAVRLRASNGSTYPLVVMGAASCYRLAARLPPGIPDGNYTVEVNNGLLSLGDAMLAYTEKLQVSAAAAPRWRNATWTVGVHCNATTIGVCLALARAAGGGTVFVPPGFYRMPTGSTLGIGAYVALSGMTARPADTVLSWDDEVGGGSTCALVPWRASTSRFPCMLIYNAELYASAGVLRKPFALRNITILVTSPAYKIIQMSDCVGCEVLNVAINVTNDPVRFPLSAPYPPLYVTRVEQWRAVGLHIVSGVGYCGNGSVLGTNHPMAAPYRLDAVNDGRLWDVTAKLGCLGWSMSCLQRTSIERTDVRTTSATRQRGNSLNPFCGTNVNKLGNDHVYFGQNYDAGTDVGQTWETFTGDGSGGSYAGNIVAIGVDANSGRQTLQTEVVRPGVNAATNYALTAGQSIVIVSGPGVGQWRLISVATPVMAGVNATGAYMLQVDKPFSAPLRANASVATITIYKGKLVFEGNEWTNGTTVQTYGSTLDLVMSGNVLRNFYTGGLSVWGLGLFQPSLRALVEHNSMLCSGNIASFTSMPASSPDLGINTSISVLNYAHVLRRNNLTGSGDIVVRGQVWDAIVEGNVFGKDVCPVKVLAACPNIGGCNSVRTTGANITRGPGTVVLGGGNGYDRLQVPRSIYINKTVVKPQLPIVALCTTSATPTPTAAVSVATTTSTASASSSASVSLTATASSISSTSLTASMSSTTSVSPNVTYAATGTGRPTLSPSSSSLASLDPAAAARDANTTAASGESWLSRPAVVGLAAGCSLVFVACCATGVGAALLRWRVKADIIRKPAAAGARNSWAPGRTFHNPSRGANGVKGIQMTSILPPSAAKPARASRVGLQRDRDTLLRGRATLAPAPLAGALSPHVARASFARSTLSPLAVSMRRASVLRPRARNSFHQVPVESPSDAIGVEQGDDDPAPSSQGRVLIPRMSYASPASQIIVSQTSLGRASVAAKQSFMPNSIKVESF